MSHILAAGAPLLAAAPGSLPIMTDFKGEFNRNSAAFAMKKARIEGANRRTFAVRTAWGGELAYCFRCNTRYAAAMTSRAVNPYFSNSCSGVPDSA